MKNSYLNTALFLLSFFGLCLLSGCQFPEKKSEHPDSMIPSFWSDTLSMRVFEDQALQERKQGQIAATKPYSNLLNFRFEDRSLASKITFDSPAPSAENVELYHYDHLGSVCVADVDGDGDFDLFFTSLAGANELWLNQGDATFALSSHNDLIALKGYASAAASFGDINNDGRPDLIVTTVKHGLHLFENSGGGKFKDISANLGSLPLRHSSAATFFDFNNDGLLDLLVTNVGKFTKEKQFSDGTFQTIENAFAGAMDPNLNENLFLFKNLGKNRFAEVSKEFGLNFRAWSGDVLAHDIDGDGFQDLYVMNMMGPNLFFLNKKGKGFVEATGQYFPRTPMGVMGGKFFDANNDGLADLFLTDMHIDMGPKVLAASQGELERQKTDPKTLPFFSESGASNFLKQVVLGNAFYQNLGSGKFEESSDRLNLENYWPWGVSVGDVNADGYEDIFISSGMGLPFRYGVSSLKINSSGQKFIDTEFVAGIEPHRQPIERYYQLDCRSINKAHSWCAYCSGQGKESDPRCSERDKNGKSVVRGATSDRSSAFVDLNGDGALDLVISEFKGPPLIYINRFDKSRGMKWLSLKLKGKESNRDGLGAKVKIALEDGRTFFRWNDGKSGYLAQSSLPLYFGFGPAAKIKGVQIDWPSGRVQKINGLKVGMNQTLVVKEP